MVVVCACGHLEGLHHKSKGYCLYTHCFCNCVRPEAVVCEKCGKSTDECGLFEDGSVTYKCDSCGYVTIDNASGRSS